MYLKILVGLEKFEDQCWKTQYAGKINEMI